MYNITMKVTCYICSQCQRIMYDEIDEMKLIGTYLFCSACYAEYEHDMETLKQEEMADEGVDKD